MTCPFGVAVPGATGGSVALPAVGVCPVAGVCPAGTVAPGVCAVAPLVAVGPELRLPPPPPQAASSVPVRPVAPAARANDRSRRRVNLPARPTPATCSIRYCRVESSTAVPFLRKPNPPSYSSSAKTWTQALQQATPSRSLVGSRAPQYRQMDEPGSHLGLTAVCAELKRFHCVVVCKVNLSRRINYVKRDTLRLCTTLHSASRCVAPMSAGLTRVTALSSCCVTPEVLALPPIPAVSG